MFAQLIQGLCLGHEDPLAGQQPRLPSGWGRRRTFDILFPGTARTDLVFGAGQPEHVVPELITEGTLSSLAGLREVCDSVLDSRPPESDENFIRWMAGEEFIAKPTPPSSTADADLVRPNTKRTARALAEHFILVDRAQALQGLGERDEGIRLVQD